LNLYGYGAGDLVNWLDPDGRKQWSQAEVREILELYSFDLDSRSRAGVYEMMYERHKGGGVYDFWVTQQHDTFLVASVGELDSAQFGNFIAGYAAGYRYDLYALIMVRIAGAAYGLVPGIADIFSGRAGISAIYFMGDSVESVTAINQGFLYGEARCFEHDTPF
jgi:hypothetical protein